MKVAAFVFFLTCAGLLSVPAADGARAETEPPAVAQTGPRCGPEPMKPISCLNGTWVCRCRGSGQVCGWELIGCQPVPGIPRRPDDTRPGLDPARPDGFSR